MARGDKMKEFFIKKPRIAPKTTAPIRAKEKIKRRNLIKLIFLVISQFYN